MTQHMDDHRELLRRKRWFEQLEGKSSTCTGIDFTHFVRDDNPMMTGRCEHCRQFVIHTNNGWRTATMREAARWGKLGAIRLSDAK